jgi:hypothetical protein
MTKETRSPNARQEAICLLKHSLVIMNQRLGYLPGNHSLKPVASGVVVW